MSETLYHRLILDKAKAASSSSRLDPADGSATVDNPLCGDRVTIDVRLDGEQVTAVGQKVRGCILCEAAAMIISEQAPGQTIDELKSISQAAEAMIRKGIPSQDLWSDLQAFAAVHETRNRHDCVLLPFEALIKAAETGSRE